MRRIAGLTSELLTSIDVLNTLNGGSVESQLKLSQHADHRHIDVFVPGIPAEQIKAEIHNNQLTIYYNQLVRSGEHKIKMPKIVYNKQIPYFIDQERIKASFEENRLEVVLPFNELANGYHRDIISSD